MNQNNDEICYKSRPPWFWATRSQFFNLFDIIFQHIFNTFSTYLFISSKLTLIKPKICLKHHQPVWTNLIVFNHKHLLQSIQQLMYVEIDFNRVKLVEIFFDSVEKLRLCWFYSGYKNQFRTVSNSTKCNEINRSVIEDNSEVFESFWINTYISNFNKVKQYFCVRYHAFIGVTRSKCYHGIFKVFDMYVYSEKTLKVQLLFQTGVGARLRFQAEAADGSRSHNSLLAISWPKY